jgi:AcrR family transcriptional regulator
MNRQSDFKNNDGMTMGTKERRLREKNNRIRTIQDAAKSVFFQKGFQGTTMEEIAKMAEVGKGTIYLYFKNKEDLYASILLNGIQRLRKRLLGFAEDLEKGKLNSSSDVVMGFFRVNFEHYAENPDSLRIYRTFQMNNLLLSLSKKNYERINTEGGENLRIARRIIAKAIEMGIFPDLNPVQVVNIFWATFLGNVQVGESKTPFGKKDYLADNTKLSFSLLAQGIKSLGASPLKYLSGDIPETVPSTEVLPGRSAKIGGGDF